MKGTGGSDSLTSPTTIDPQGSITVKALFAKCIDGGDPGGNAVIRLQWNRRKSATSAGGQYELRIEPISRSNPASVARAPAAVSTARRYFRHVMGSQRFLV